MSRFLYRYKLLGRACKIDENGQYMKIRTLFFEIIVITVIFPSTERRNNRNRVKIFSFTKRSREKHRNQNDRTPDRNERYSDARKKREIIFRILRILKFTHRFKKIYIYMRQLLWNYLPYHYTFPRYSREPRLVSKANHHRPLSNTSPPPSCTFHKECY